METRKAQNLRAIKFCTFLVSPISDLFRISDFEFGIQSLPCRLEPPDFTYTTSLDAVDPDPWLKYSARAQASDNRAEKHRSFPAGQNRCSG
jgi:hypothetical protein